MVKIVHNLNHEDHQREKESDFLSFYSFADIMIFL